ncbi:GTPase family protein [Aeromonas media]|uniref:GTPase family protein n=1 Tax=Aeromonas media TaxID=651 RepID=UPI000F96791C|nr:GTPase [Aeromonas media]MBS4698309.1 50S ribosome-binding GTPase [Aeromonas media]QIY86048.1 GTP-binding protein [Aeromonas hydrophila]
MGAYDKDFFKDLQMVFNADESLSDLVKAEITRNMAKLKDTKINILMVGATGCGKSSTINALFNTEAAKVGQGVDPETMTITKYEMRNINIFDSPGLGDGKDADDKHARKIVAKLYEKDGKGELLIDLVMVILDGSSRDLGTSFQLINDVIIPNLGKDKSRLLVAINQADMAMKGRCWNHTTNQPEPELVEFLEKKVRSTHQRIKEATGVDVEPIYYAAGYKDGDAQQNPYNLSKLLAFILRHTKPEKRAAYVNDLNHKNEQWQDDDKREDYRREVRDSVWDSVVYGATAGAKLGGDLGGRLGPAGKIIGSVIGGALGALGGLFFG